MTPEEKQLIKDAYRSQNDTADDFRDRLDKWRRIKEERDEQERQRTRRTLLRLFGPPRKDLTPLF